MALAADDLWVDGLREPPPPGDRSARTVQERLALALDDVPNLVGLRFRLVPCWMTETAFWRIFFYSVGRVRARYLTEPPRER